MTGGKKRAATTTLDPRLAESARLYWYKRNVEVTLTSATIEEMTDAEYRALHVLADKAWKRGGRLPQDISALERLAGKPWAIIEPIVSNPDFFQPVEDGTLACVLFDMQAQWASAASQIEAQSQGGRKGARTRVERYGKAWVSPSQHDHVAGSGSGSSFGAGSGFDGNAVKKKKEQVGESSDSAPQSSCFVCNSPTEHGKALCPSCEPDYGQDYARQ